MTYPFRGSVPFCLLLWCWPCCGSAYVWCGMVWGVYADLGASFSLNSENEYTWILWQEKFSHQFRLLTRTSFIGQFVYQVEGEGMVYGGWIRVIIILVSCDVYFIRVHENLVENPRNNISIILTILTCSHLVIRVIWIINTIRSIITFLIVIINT